MLSKLCSFLTPLSSKGLWKDMEYSITLPGSTQTRQVVLRRWSGPDRFPTNPDEGIGSLPSSMWPQACRNIGRGTQTSLAVEVKLAQIGSRRPERFMMHTEASD